MDPKTQTETLTESIANADLPGDENDARTPQSPPSTPSSEPSSPAASEPPTLKDGGGPRPFNEVGTEGHSDAPKVAPAPVSPDAKLPDPTETGEAG